MIQVRTSVFETNSSSIHSICIARGDRRKPKDWETTIVLTVTMQHFGWEFRKLDTPDLRASYAYTAAVDLDLGADMKELIWELCGEEGINVVFQDSDDAYFYGVDHCDGTYDFVKALLHNKRLLKDFIFCKNSCVFTGNDNSEAPSKLALDEDSWHDKNPGGIIYFKSN